MLPAEIKAEQFNGYPPQARQVAVNHIDLFRQLPLAFAPLILQQLEQYDWKFPAERREIDHQLSYLSSRSGPEMSSLLSEFERLKLSRQLEQFNWVDAPGTFSQQLSAYLWATHQIDRFRGAAEKLMDKVNASMPPEQLAAPRLGIVVVGRDVKESQYPLFRKLRAYGTRFTRVNPSNGLRILLETAAARAKAHPVPFGHWYVDGGPAETIPGDTLLSVSYTSLEPVRKAILQKITRAINGGIGGPEALTSMLFKLRPEQVGLSGKPEDEIIGHLETSIFTQGQGTQIFSTTFVQWTAREVLRRAHPLTLVARFAPRQRQRPMNELLSGKDTNPEPDPMGSLIDADMGAFLTWIDQQRLSGANQSSFLAWFEDHNEAVALSPFLPHNTESDTAIDMNGLLNQMGLKTVASREVPQREATQSSSLNPAHDNYVLDGVDNNLDSVDFLNGADYGDTA